MGGGGAATSEDDLEEQRTSDQKVSNDGCSDQISWLDDSAHMLQIYSFPLVSMATSHLARIHRQRVSVDSIAMKSVCYQYEFDSEDRLLPEIDFTIDCLFCVVLFAAPLHCSPIVRSNAIVSSMANSHLINERRKRETKSTEYAIKIIHLSAYCRQWKESHFSSPIFFSYFVLRKFNATIYKLNLLVFSISLERKQ